MADAEVSKTSGDKPSEFESRSSHQFKVDDIVRIVHDSNDDNIGRNGKIVYVSDKIDLLRQGKYKNLVVFPDDTTSRWFSDKELALVLT